MWAAIAATLAAVFPVHLPGPQPLAFDGPSGRVAVSGWLYRSDPAATGIAAGWAAGRFGGAPVRVPNTSNPVGTGPATSTGFRGSVGWYVTTVQGTGGNYALRFERASSRADAWVDGRHLGSHDGPFDPFDFETPLPPGPHRLVVRVDWRSPVLQSAAGFHRTWFNYGGLNGEVTLQKLTASEVTGAAVETSLARRSASSPVTAARVDIAVRVVNRGPRRRLRVAGRLRKHEGALRFLTSSRMLARGQATTLHARITVPRPELWSPGHGVRYELDLSIPRESGFRARIGLRTIASAGGRLRVNGIATILRGASLHEDSPTHGDALTPSEMDATVHHLQAIGANTVRSQHPLAAPLLERLDAAGILVWEQIGPVDSPGAWLATTPALRDVATGRVQRALRAARLHPSIAVWALGVEVAGNGAPGQAQWVDARAKALKAADPGRLVGVDIWGPFRPAKPGLLYAHLDAIGFTSYFGWYEDTLAPLSRATADLRARVAAYARTFPGRLLVLTEFGAEGTPSSENASAARGGRGYQAALFSAELAALRGQPLGGALAWVLGDFAINPAFHGGTVTKSDPAIHLTPGLNQKGLFDRSGRPKPATATVRAGLAALG